jgi:NADPH:quinone reductase-like Zn-dependent oxidoreductase
LKSRNDIDTKALEGTMKAVRYHSYGGTDVLRYEDAARPRAAAGQVLIKVAATSFNPVDIGIRAGYLQQVFPVQFPHIPGIDVAGTVAELGEGVGQLRVGDAVIGLLPMNEDGAAAEFVVAPAEVLTAGPRTIPLTAGAAIPAVALTAWQALFEHARLQTGQRILINGAGAGVASFAAQFAKQAGAAVIATANGPSTDEIVDNAIVPVTEAIGEPVDAILNLVAASDTEMTALVDLIRPGGVIVTTVTPAPADTERNVRTVSMNVRSDAKQLSEIVAEIDAGNVHVEVSRSVLLSEIASVHKLGATGQLHGKVVLVPAT